MDEETTEDRLEGKAELSWYNHPKETPGEKVARIFYWDDLGRFTDRVFNKRHLIYAEAAPYAFTTPMVHLGPKPIVAVHQSPEAALLMLGVPGKVVAGNAWSVVHDYPRKLSSLFFDFNRSLSEEVLAEIRRVLVYGLADEGFVGFSCYMGQEDESLRRQCDRSGYRDIVGSDEELSDVGQVMLARVGFLVHHFSPKSFSPQRMCLLPQVGFYIKNPDDSMVGYFMFQLHRQTGTSAFKWEHWQEQAFLAMRSMAVRNCSYNAETLQRRLVRLWNEAPLVLERAPTAFKSLQDLRTHICFLYSVDPRVVATWM